MKYRNVKTEAYGIKFDSRRESERYAELYLMAKAREIQGLEVQPVYVLAPKVKYQGAQRTKPELRYRADFAYTTKTGEKVVEDVKGVETEAFRIKRHLMKWLHGIDVRVVK